MKKPITFILILTTLLAAACSTLPEPDDIDAPGDQVVLIKAELARETNPDATMDQIQALADDNTAFALSFYDQVRTGNENLIFSPISLSLALSMTLTGAETSTLEAMRSALQLSLAEDAVHPAFNALLLAIEESQKDLPDEIEGSKFQLNIANSIWGQVDFPFKQPFIDTLAFHYGAGIHTLDFAGAPEPSREVINAWVEDETEGKIQDLLPQGSIDSLTRLVLANAIYFNGSWRFPFPRGGTKDAPFTTIDGEEMMVEMMRLSEKRLLYHQGDDFQAVQLPYISPDFAMTIIPPDDGDFLKVEDDLTPEMIQALHANFQSELMHLQMPKLDFETTIGAKEVLMDLGMAEAFDPALSDFTGMADVEDLYISDVLHKATINVDEVGTEAAAATAVIVAETSAPIDEPISMVVDRPFLFLIRHTPTGTILFMGSVMQP